MITGKVMEMPSCTVSLASQTLTKNGGFLKNYKSLDKMAFSSASMFLPHIRICLFFLKVRELRRLKMIQDFCIDPGQWPPNMLVDLMVKARTGRNQPAVQN